ncbi:MAG: hypothetical protein WDM70_04120 [Nitrosomonadales bacterium]
MGGLPDLPEGLPAIAIVATLSDGVAGLTDASSGLTALTALIGVTVTAEFTSAPSPPTSGLAGLVFAESVIAEPALVGPFNFAARQA